MKRKILVISLVIIAVGLAAVLVYRQSRQRASSAGTVSPSPAAAKPTVPAAELAVSLEPGTFADLAYSSAEVAAQVKPYRVAADLSNLANRRLLPTLTPQQRQALVSNAFVGWPTQEQQLFFIYENNAYKNIPSFITTDSVLQAYHIFYDFSLRYVEAAHLDRELRQMTASLLSASKEMLESHAAPGLLHDACLKNVAYFGVASRLLGENAEIPTEAKDMITAELEKIESHSARQPSSIFPYMIEFTQFIPRGHYTRSEQLKRYFKTMMWYGLAPFALEWPESTKKTPGIPDREQTLQALLICRMLEETGAWKSWDAIYYPTVFYVGRADDMTPAEYRQLAGEVFGKEAPPQRLADPQLLDGFIARAKKLRPPKIETFALGVPNGPQFRLMGQRFIPDSRILQEMTFPKVRQFREEFRTFPRGLDVAAALESSRAAYHLDSLYHETRFPGYLDQRRKMQQEMAATTPETWQSNLYWGWLFTLRPLLEPKGEGYPSFMLNQAWLDKQLVASLASWAELRHDTILYGKQSVSECGDGEEPPPPPKGYVEPEPEVYARLAWLTKLTAQGLKSRGLLDQDLEWRFKEFEDLLEFLLNCSLKELRNQELTREEYEEIKHYGATLERLTLQLVQAGEEGGTARWSELTSAADKDMAVVADVHTSFTECLEEGVGRAIELWVVVPIAGKLWLTRGASFSYYEFRHPSADRLTDEKWQQMLSAKNAPPMPSWTSSYVVGEGKNKPLPAQEMEMTSSGC